MSFIADLQANRNGDVYALVAIFNRHSFGG